MKTKAQIELKQEELDEQRDELVSSQLGDSDVCERYRSQSEALGWTLGQCDPPADNVSETGRPATEDEIKYCIEQLKQERETIPERSAFFDYPNWLMIDGQIEILTWVIDDNLAA